MAGKGENGLLDNNEINKRITEAYQGGDVEAVNGLALEVLDKWKECPINIGITGNSGVGKSSFINALRGLTADDKGSAAVGVVETTREPKSYQHPNNEKMLLWDLPGVGTPRFLRQDYLERIECERYDYFIILSASRFTENDQWLGKELNRRNKKFYFVRTKTGIDVENDKKSHPKTHDKKKVIDSIRDDCTKNGILDVYTIDSYETNNYDFQYLSEKMIIDAPELKRECMLYTLQCSSEKIILVKKEKLKLRIAIHSLLTVVSNVALSFIPIPSLGRTDVAINMTIIVTEAQFYKQQFGLSNEALERIVELTGIHLKSLELATQQLAYTVKGIGAFSASLGRTQMAGSSMVKRFLASMGILGLLVSGTASGLFCAATLWNLLDMHVDDALKVNKFLLEKRVTDKRSTL